MLTAVDVDHDGSFGGSNRVTLTTNDVVPDNGTTVNRSRVFVWQTNGSSASNLVSTTETSVNGLTSWSIAWNNNGTQGLTNRSVTVYAGGGNRYVTNIAPDNSYTVAAYQHGLLMSSRRYTNGSQIAQTTYGYDAYWRQNMVTDARTGTTTNWFNAMEEVSGTATPVPGPGQSSQVTSYNFDNMGRVTNTTLPDGTSVISSYYPTGLTATNGGSRTYPVAYVYDAQGRMTNMTTWGQAGPEATTWNYDPNRGWLNSKKYPDTNGPSYTYTPAGRLAGRFWARGTSTTNINNAAGDVASVVYNDGQVSVLTNDTFCAD